MAWQAADPGRVILRGAWADPPEAGEVICGAAGRDHHVDRSTELVELELLTLPAGGEEASLQLRANMGRL